MKIRNLINKLLVAIFAITFIFTGSNSFASKGETLILAIGGERSEGYDPTLGWGRYGNPLFQSTLLKRDENLNIRKDLAVSYKLSQDLLTWKITIRDDVRFSDGRKLTASDVVFTFNKAAQTGGKMDLTVLEKAVKTGPYSLELKLKKPWITFINNLITLGIVPEHYYSKSYGRKPMGSGPYMLKHWEEGQYLSVVANPFYYGKEPSIKKITFLFADEDTSFAAAKAGKVHVVAVPQSLAVQTIKGMKIHAVKSVDNRGIMFPCVPDRGLTTKDGYAIGNNVTSDPAIRKAVNYALNRKYLVEGILEGYGTPAYGNVDGLPWGNQNIEFKDGDIKKAKNILSMGGWVLKRGSKIREKKGLKAEFKLIYPSSDSIRQSLALASSDILRKIGINIKVIGKSWDEIKRFKHSSAILFGWGSHDPSEMYNLYHSAKSGQEYFNSGFYKNRKVDRYLEKAMASPSFKKSLKYWKKAQWDKKTGCTVFGDAPWAWLVNLQHTYFVSNNLDIGKSQVEPHGHGWPITANINKWKWK